MWNPNLASDLEISRTKYEDDVAYWRNLQIVSMSVNMQVWLFFNNLARSRKSTEISMWTMSWWLRHGHRCIFFNVPMNMITSVLPSFIQQWSTNSLMQRQIAGLQENSQFAAFQPIVFFSLSNSINMFLIAISVHTHNNGVHTQIFIAEMNKS